MELKLSRRLTMIAEMVTPGLSVSDIGCDHGLVSIYLVAENIAKKVFAMDIVEGPLAAAKANIEKFGYADKIETRLSNGFERLAPGESECAIIAGMGGRLIIDILKGGLKLFVPGYELVLSPQSDVPAVRIFLREQGFEIVDEEMIIDEEKYYNIIKAVKRADGYNPSDDQLQEMYDFLGQKLIEKKSPVLKLYLDKELEKKQGIYCRLSKKTGDNIIDRLSQLDHDILLMAKARDMLEK